ncbi:hypothetical protein [Anaerotruncus sp. 1XD42-93]|jgi:hypothetical protein|nr:hypothetical protein [Anaerotruncus sp. 1XD42-93]MCI9234807.1 hypothetical protein [Anaerotruncus sp.]NBK17579.1 hypothetical protein [Anaerotruncus sp. 1XD42-93]RKJ85442.1 hypothetical protein D7Y41_20420 [Anaerotruncus sp. 1XD22-93]
MTNQKDFRLFFVSFLLTLMAAGWVTLFFWVDSTNSQYENTAPSPALALSQTSQLVWNAQFLGQNYTLSLDPFNRLEQGRKTYASLTTPQSVRLLEQAYSLAVYSWNKFYISYRENQFRQNVESQE